MLRSDKHLLPTSTHFSRLGRQGGLICIAMACRLMCCDAQLFAAPFLQDQQQSAATPEGPPAAAAAAQTSTSIPIAEISVLLQDLSSPEFARRQAAAGKLQASVADTAGLTLIDRELRSSVEPERVRRLLEILEAQYERCDFRSPEAVTLSELLEQSAFSDSWFVSEAARSILKRLWKRRIEIAVTELRRLRVPLEPSDPSELWKADDNARNMAANPTLRSQLRIYADEHWPADPRVFVLLRRFAELSPWPRVGGGIVTVYQLQGHPLKAEQTAELKAIFGDMRVEERGRVCLGIVSEQGLNNISGAMIRDVETGSSADLAGLKPGDLIQSVNGREIEDFQELVTLLRDYNVGDKVTLRVISLNSQLGQNLNRQIRIMPFPPAGPNAPALPPAPFPIPAPEKKPNLEPVPEKNVDPFAPRDVEVVLQGWYDPELIKKPLP
ncbi:MAG: PDZ domain-containing protein [Planctomycetaceae bacterium]